MDKGNFTINPVVVNELTSQGKLIIKTFGINQLKQKLFVIAPSETLRAENRARTEGNKNAHLSAFGLPVFDVLVFSRKQYTNDNDEEVYIGEFNMGIALIEINQTKNIVTTAVAGRPGTVKEYISDGDYFITIRGVISSNAQDVYPENEVAELIKFLQVPESLEVGSNILHRFGITDMVVTTYSFPVEEGMRNVQRFTIEAMSETAFELSQNK